MVPFRKLSWLAAGAVLRPVRRGFTLVQVLVVLAIVAVLASMAFPVLGRYRAQVRSTQCDVKLKSIVLALDTFRQEKNQFPRELDQLTTEGYLTEADALRCPEDPRPHGSLADFYAVRAKRDEGNLPIVVCPFHEAYTGEGHQGRLGKFTTTFLTRPAELASGNNVSVWRPGKPAPITGYAGMELRGGDRLEVGSLGTGRIRFADGTLAQLTGGTDITVLQSFVDGQNSGPLYSLVKQVSGDVTYTINHGSRFDVVTPVATAGARGTKFRIKVTGTGENDTQLIVEEGKVTFTAKNKTGLAPVGQWIGLLNLGNLLGWLL